MYTLKSGRYPIMKGGKKKKLINILEELLGINQLTFGNVEQLEDRKTALELSEEHKLKRRSVRFHLPQTSRNILVPTPHSPDNASHRQSFRIYLE